MTTSTPSTSHNSFARIWRDLQCVHLCSDGTDSQRMTNAPTRFLTNAAKPYASNATNWHAYGRQYFTRTTA